MSFASFMSLIQTYTLHFHRIDKFGDHFEGFWPKKDHDWWSGVEGFSVAEFTKKMMCRTAASCWFEVEAESAAMWALYASEAEGIAITTTFEQLDQLMSKGTSSNHWLSGAGRVQYLDYLRAGYIENLGEHELVPNSLQPFMSKHIAYAHECEVRALIVDQPNHTGFEESGLNREVDLQDFVGRIVVSPKSPKWFFNIVETAVKQSNLTIEVETSELSTAAHYVTGVKV